MTLLRIITSLRDSVHVLEILCIVVTDGMYVCVDDKLWDASKSRITTHHFA